MAALNFDALGVRKMASGHLCLNLSEKVGWRDFPDFANRLLEVLDGEVLDRADGVDIRMWKVSIGGRKVDLVFDDYPLMMALESSDDEGDVLIRELHKKLAQCK